MDPNKGAASGAPTIFWDIDRITLRDCFVVRRMRTSRNDDAGSGLHNKLIIYEEEAVSSAEGGFSAFCLSSFKRLRASSGVS